MADDDQQQQHQTQQQTKKEPETFSREYVQELRHENAAYRTKAQEKERLALEADERVKKVEEESKTKVSQAEEAANRRVIQAELKAVAVKAGMVDLDGLKLADLSTVKLNDKGEVEGADELMKALKESKPYLFQVGTSTSSTEKTPDKKDDKIVLAKDLPAADYTKAKQDIKAGKLPKFVPN